MSMGKRLSELRDAKDWTLDELAEASEISAPYISKLERDKALPQRGTLKAILDALDPEAGDVLLERDRLELERLGYTPESAKLLVLLEQLDPETRTAVIDRVASELADLRREPEDPQGSANGDANQEAATRRAVAAR